MTAAHHVRCAIALGSNLGDRAATLRSAIEALREADQVRVIRVSSFIETEPVGPPGQGPYLNAAAVLETSLPARALLDLMLEIEREHGRDRRGAVPNGPRTLDLDLLLYGDAVISEPGLVVPHPRMLERRFVLDPLCEIAPDMVHPLAGRRVQSFASS